MTTTRSRMTGRRGPWEALLLFDPSRLRPVTAWRCGFCHGSWMRGAGLQHHAPQGNKNVATILAPATPTLST